MPLSQRNPGKHKTKFLLKHFHFLQVDEPSLCAGDPPDCLVGGDQGGWAIKGEKVVVIIKEIMARLIC